MRVVLILILCGASVAIAATPMIELNDGSRVRGEIVALENGVYTVESEHLGRIEVRQQDIRRIEYDASAESAAADASRARIQALQRDLAADGEIFSLIQQLQSDPQLKEILADPEIMRAVAAGNLAALAANPKFMQLMNNPNIRAITSKVTGNPDPR